MPTLSSATQTHSRTLAVVEVVMTGSPSEVSRAIADLSRRVVDPVRDARHAGSRLSALAAAAVTPGSDVSVAREIGRDRLASAIRCVMRDAIARGARLAA